jgi:hypothetical protein
VIIFLARQSSARNLRAAIWCFGEAEEQQQPQQGLLLLLLLLLLPASSVPPFCSWSNV